MCQIPEASTGIPHPQKNEERGDEETVNSEKETNYEMKVVLKK